MTKFDIFIIIGGFLFYFLELPIFRIQRNKNKKISRYKQDYLLYLYEYIVYNLFPKTVVIILKIGEKLYELRKSSRQIIYILYITPGLIVGLTLIFEALFFNKMYYYYYALFLLLLPFCFNLYLLMLQNEKKNLQEISQNLQLGNCINIENLTIDVLMQISLAKVLKSAANRYFTQAPHRVLISIGQVHVVLALYAKILMEPQLKKYVYLNLFLYLIGFWLVIIIYII